MAFYERNPDTGEMEPVVVDPITGEVIGTRSGIVYEVGPAPPTFGVVAPGVEAPLWLQGTNLVESGPLPKGVDVISSPRLVEIRPVGRLVFYIYEQEVGFKHPPTPPEKPPKSTLETEEQYRERLKTRPKPNVMSYEENVEQYRRMLAIYNDQLGKYAGQMWHIRGGPALSRSFIADFIAYAQELAKKDPEGAVVWLIKMEPALSTVHLESSLGIPHTTIWRIITGGFNPITPPVKSMLESDEEYQTRLSQYKDDLSVYGAKGKRMGGLLDEDKIWKIGSWRGSTLYAPKEPLTPSQILQEWKRIKAYLTGLKTYEPTPQEWEEMKRDEAKNRAHRRKQLIDYWF